MTYYAWRTCPQCGWRKMVKGMLVCVTCEERIREYNRGRKPALRKERPVVESIESRIANS